MTRGGAATDGALIEMIRKVESSLLPAIINHGESSEFDASTDGLDFLDTKNTLLISYLIELTVHIRNSMMGQSEVQPGADLDHHLQDPLHDEANMKRLIEMRTVLDKTRNLDKKLRYQIDKLLSFQSNASSFAAGGEDPLQFRPNVDAMDEDKKGDDRDDHDQDDGSSGGESESVDRDEDLKRAKQTVSASRKGNVKDDSDETPGLYRAPRLTAVPYTLDKVDRNAELEKRQRRRLRASELARALRTEFGDAPEQDDIHGGTEVGKQREAARRLAEKEAEKTRFEEDAMVRLTTTRKEKKERQKLMRAETSNLTAIANLGNIARDASLMDRDDTDNNEQNDTQSRVLQSEAYKWEA